MKIDLTKLTVRPSLLEEPKEINVKSVIADLIWKECGRDDIQKANFALKLLNAEGEIEITSQEAAFILDTTSMMKYWLAKALEDTILPKLKEDDKNNS